jgi:hypothetical protein
MNQEPLEGDKHFDPELMKLVRLVIPILQETHRTEKEYWDWYYYEIGSYK